MLSNQAPHRTVTSPLELIGNTPLLRLRSIPRAKGAQVWVKCEYQNPGGSVKDRIALAMVEDAEKRGLITPGKSVLVEPTSGNTGIGLALVCAAKGYQLVLTMPESMSVERRELLAAYGADVQLTAAERTMEGAVARAVELCREHLEYVMLDQFNNPANPQVHRETTANELIAQLGDSKLRAFVAGIGTGGTISGVGSALRERFDECDVIGIEPQSSPVISGGRAGAHRIQGIGAGFIPANLDRSVLTAMRTITDRDAYQMSRRLAREEGLLVGISSGANVHIACDVARSLSPDHVVVTVLCDTGERYLSTNQSFQ